MARTTASGSSHYSRQRSIDERTLVPLDSETVIGSVEKNFPRSRDWLFRTQFTSFATASASQRAGRAVVPPHVGSLSSK